MKSKLLFTALLLVLGITESSFASPLCDKLKIPANRVAAFYPTGLHGKLAKNKLNDAVACVNANWGKLSQRLTFRGSTTDTLFVQPSVSPVPTVTVRYTPAALYNANAATPIAFLKQPVSNVNYLPNTNYSSTQLVENTYRLNAPNLMDDVPSSNYQGNLATPIIYQTGYWNSDIPR